MEPDQRPETETRLNDVTKTPTKNKHPNRDVAGKNSQSSTKGKKKV